MSQRPFKSGQGLQGSETNILNLIHEDMEVYDVNEKHIGEVEFVYLGSVNPTGTERGTAPQTVDDIDLTDNTFVDLIGRAFGDDEMPDVIRKRLLYYGFVKVEGEGLFAADRFVTPDQIAAVRGEHVYLNVTDDDLIHD